MKKFTLSILGCGSRGGDTYGSLAFSQQDKYEITALCDTNKLKLNKYSKLFNVSEENCFLTEDEFFSKKRSDAIIIATMDRDHVHQCLKAMELGYDVLLEKPISADEDELFKLVNAQKKYGSKVIVCHVLRYAPAFVKLKELLDDGKVGKLIAIDATEQVAYWHYAHSYVRGNWRRAEDTAPMILAKCCHDLDLIQYYAKSRAKTVNSVGELTFFKKQFMPEGATNKCIDCKYINTCEYSAYKLYVEKWKNIGCPVNEWPYNVISPMVPLTEEKLLTAIKETPYGNCVFCNDNNVVDHQITTIEFENGVKAVLKMLAFTRDCGRIIKFYGTLGEIVMDEARDIIEIKPFGKPVETIKISEMIVKDVMAHGGGDAILMDSFYDILAGNASQETALLNSVESHLIGICAEKSRISGENVEVKH